jgi:hypothetical protein
MAAPPDQKVESSDSKRLEPNYPSTLLRIVHDVIIGHLVAGCSHESPIEPIRGDSDRTPH